MSRGQDGAIRAWEPEPKQPPSTWINSGGKGPRLKCIAHRRKVQATYWVEIACCEDPSCALRDLMDASRYIWREEEYRQTFRLQPTSEQRKKARARKT